jgi:hypothetical protein
VASWAWTPVEAEARPTATAKAVIADRNMGILLRCLRVGRSPGV